MQDSGEPPVALPKMDFATLILSLSASAVAHLGVAPEPGAPAPEKDLPLARQTIDILELLQEKTRGNLEPAEEELLRDALHDLHLKYVAAGSG
ncbi:MAG: DUF1844 domain-containing protein [Proteobacteria bacterium]|nr:DUF1844 domain-containing protein [Pseudomonadota bacterium]